MFIIDDIAKSVVDVASQVVETVTGGLVNPSEIIETVLQGPLDDLVMLGVGLFTGNPLAFTSLVDDLAEIFER